MSRQRAAPKAIMHGMNDKPCNQEKVQQAFPVVQADVVGEQNTFCVKSQEAD